MSSSPSAILQPGMPARNAGIARWPREDGPTRLRGRPSLAACRAPRAFAPSAELAAARGKAAQGRAFCVHQHLASTLHYDLRLEHRGALLSWAVPKGPSLDPRARRLAIAVDEHPLAYARFEGVIATGYGAGIVLLWDRGSWEPEHPDVDAALARGRLRFALHGEKLQGHWQLVRTALATGTGWLLVKDADGWARPGDDARLHPRSVASGADFAELLARERADPWPHGPPVRGGAAGDLLAEIIARSRLLRPRRCGG